MMIKKLFCTTALAKHNETMSKNINLVKKNNKLTNELFKQLLCSAFQSTICFFRNDDKKKLAPAGSGVFIKYKDYYYVVTAAHVLAEHYNDTFMLINGNGFTAAGVLHSSAMPQSGNRDDDKIDISVLKLDNQSAQELLTTFKAVDIDNIEPNHELKDTTRYFSIGYPLTRTKLVWGGKNELKSSASIYQSEPFLNFNFTKFGFKSGTTIAIKYDGKVTSSINPHPHLSPNPTGISGSGLWYFSNYNRKSLIGIVIQQTKEPSHKSLLVTKIDLVLKIIDRMP